MKITEGRVKVELKPDTWREKRQELIDIVNFKYNSQTLEEEFDVDTNMSNKILRQFKQLKGKTK